MSDTSTLRRWFGTDGIRGRVGTLPITPEAILRLGFAVGAELVATSESSKRPKVLIGKDTRISGYMLESALEAGFSAAGVDVVLVGPMPTPAVAYLTKALRLQAGVMISASHNPFDDNGIKFFNGAGAKLPDSWELAIEARLDQPMQTRSSKELGKVRRLDDAPGRYVEFCKSAYPSDLDLKGVKIALDCAHGACYHVTPPVFHELGADIHVMGNTPDGININERCGATHTQAIVEFTRTTGADFGIAVDGDGDRLMMCDSHGRVYDGDDLLYAIAIDRHAKGVLGGGVVGTLMTNFAVERAFAEKRISFERAKVGDRYVLETLLKNNWLLGGENSGHLICLDRHTTGDATVAALQVLAVMRSNQTSLADYLGHLQRLPQVLVNVRVEHAHTLQAHPDVLAATHRVQENLKGRGRVLLRASGTEPLLRVMVEGEDLKEVHALAEELADIVRKAA